MANYDFGTLSPADFEDLVRDLLQAEWGVRLEAFARGRDTGIDLRYAQTPPHDVVVQCKHYRGTGYRGLLRTMQAEEREKIERLSPDRYVLVTSVPMTPTRKEALLNVLSPWVSSFEDIVGPEDLNNLLGRHPDVEQQHHKLWLTSSAVLRRILHASSFFQAAATKEAIEHKLKLYVQTRAFDRAVEIMDEHGYVLISGNPGIGKTTLAEMLIVRLLEHDYDLVVVQQDIREAYDRLTTGGRTVIYYDDFLGRASLGEKLGKNEDASLLRLLATVRLDRARRLILTTREYLLRQAKLEYETLQDETLEVAKCVIELEDYSRASRARILYNHLHFSTLPAKHVHNLVASGRHRSIVDHPNYSPRIIEWMTQSLRFDDTDSNEYGQQFLTNLDDPSNVWQHAFERQISPLARRLLLVLASMQGPVEYDGFQEACIREGIVGPTELGVSELRLRFLCAVREVDGSFIAARRLRDTHALEVGNPSIREFLRHRIARDEAVWLSLLRDVLTFDQLEYLVRMERPSGAMVHEYSAPEDASDVIADAMRVTVDAPVLRVRTIELRSGDSLFLRLSQSPLDRMVLVLGWAVQSGSQTLARVGVDALLDALRNDPQASEDTVRLCSAIPLLVQLETGRADGAHHARKEAVELALKSVEIAPASDGWSAVKRVLDASEDVPDMPDVCSISDDAHAWLTSELDDIRASIGVEDAQDLYYRLDELQTAANVWSSEFDLDTEGLEERIEKLWRDESANVDEDAQNVGPNGRDDEPPMSDSELDDLFSTLAAGGE